MLLLRADAILRAVGTLGAMVAGILALCAWLGLAPALTAPPGWCRRRWPLAAPLAGLSLTMLAASPLAAAGLPVRAIWPILVSLVSAANFALLARSRAARRTLRHGAALLRHRGARLALAAAAVVLLAALLIGQRGANRVTDVWGAGDFQCTWQVVDYVLRHGATVRAMEAQAEFRSPIVLEHLVLWGRLGGMSCLALLSDVFTPDRTYAILNPATVAFMVMALLALEIALDRWRVRSAWPLALAACHPVLYFPAFAAATGQAMAIPVLVLAALLVEGTLEEPRPAAPRVAAGAALAACAVSYPATLPAILVLGALAAADLLRRPDAPRARALYHVAATAFLASCYRLPIAIGELVHSARVRPMPGWEWLRPIGFLELTGLNTVLGFALPAPAPGAAVLASELALGAALLTGFAVALRSTRRRLVPVALLATSAAMGAVALCRVLAGELHATFAWTKVLMQFTLVLLPFAVAPAFVAPAFAVAQALDVAPAFAPRSRLRRAVPLVGALWIALQVTNVVTTRAQAEYGPELVRLVERLRRPGRKLVAQIRGRWDPYELAPVVRDFDRLLLVPRGRTPPGEKFAGEVLHVTRREHVAAPADAEGPYAAAPPPPALEPARLAGWILEGAASVETGGRVTLLMGKPGGTLVLAVDGPASVRVAAAIDGVPLPPAGRDAASGAVRLTVPAAVRAAPALHAIVDLACPAGAPGFTLTRSAFER